VIKEAVLRLENITKFFPGVRALDRVDFDLYPGEVHVLIGENGAGKSTLIKIISGAYKKDYGKIFISSQETEINNPRHALELGIATVYQELNLIPYLSVAENIFLGRQPLKKGPLRFINKKRMLKESKKLLDSLEIDINPKTNVGKLGIAQKQMVEIAKAFSIRSKICIFDEPTAALTPNEIKELFLLIEKLKSENVGIIYISHRLEEVYEIGNRITVLRNGQYIDTKPIDEVSTNDLVEMMIGRRIEELEIESDKIIGGEILGIENLTGERFKDINLHVMAGEIVGLAGLVGAGRTEVLRGIFGADKIYSGRILLKGNELSIKKPRTALNNRIALLPEDRKDQGLILCRSVEENVILSSLDFFSTFGILRRTKIFKTVKEYINRGNCKNPTFCKLPGRLENIIAYVVSNYIFDPITRFL